MIGPGMRRPTIDESSDLPPAFDCYYSRGPDTIDIKVGFRCNDRCVHCVVDPLRIALGEDSRRADLSTEEIKALIDRALLDGARKIVLTGGEVSIRKDFEEIVRHASRQGLKIIIQTNGRRLSNLKCCVFLADVPDVLFVVALHGPEAQVHEAVTTVRGSFAQTMKALENLIRLGKPVATKTVVSKLNQHSLLATMQLIQSIGINEASIAFPHALGFAETRFQEVIPRYSDIAEQIEATAKFSESAGVAIDYETIPYCVCPTSDAFWKRNLDLHANARRESEDIPLDPSSREWEAVRPTMKMKFPQCEKCLLATICEGVWNEYAKHFGGGEFRPILERAEC